MQVSKAFRSIAMHLLLAIGILLAPHFARAQTSPTETPTVQTRAIVQSISDEDGGKRIYIRLKLLPRAKIPFTTLTYRVLNRDLVAGVQKGASVTFVAERIDGENTLTSIRVATPCEGFRKCE